MSSFSRKSRRSADWSHQCHMVTISWRWGAQCPSHEAFQVTSVSPGHLTHLYYQMAPEGICVHDLWLNYKAFYKCSKSSWSLFIVPCPLQIFLTFSQQSTAVLQSVSDNSNIWSIGGPVSPSFAHGVLFPCDLPGSLWPGWTLYF